MDFQDTPVTRFYDGAHVLITGGTGFMGRILIEKLLRSCPGIQRIYLIIRLKKGKEPSKRFNDLFSDAIFGQLRVLDPNFEQKITLISGDCGAIGLGISEEDRLLLTANVTHVFHGAATVRFDEQIKKALLINVQGVREILKLCKEITADLKVVVHVSTAYSNCPLRHIDEEFGTSPLPGHKALKLLEVLDEDQLNRITPSLIDPWPNTYSFSKCIAEDIIKNESGNLPVTIIRPSIVVACNKEPIPGWIDNVYGPTGVSAAVAVGLLRVLCANADYKADLVPVDMATNGIICAAWRVGTNFKTKPKPPLAIIEDFESSEENGSKENIPIFNYVSSPENSLDWRHFKIYNLRNASRLGCIKAIWMCMINLTKYHTWFKIQIFFLHTIPAYLVDAVLIIQGKKPRLVEGYKKIHKFCEVIRYFATQQWTFSEKNLIALRDSLSPEDQKKFHLDMRDVNWSTFFDINLEAMRIFIIKEGPETLPAGCRKQFIFTVCHYILSGFFICLLLWLIWPVVTFLFSWIFNF